MICREQKDRFKNCRRMVTFALALFLLPVLFLPAFAAEGPVSSGDLGSMEKVIRFILGDIYKVIRNCGSAVVAVVIGISCAKGMLSDGDAFSAKGVLISCVITLALLWLLPAFFRFIQALYEGKFSYTAVIQRDIRAGYNFQSGEGGPKGLTRYSTDDFINSITPVISIVQTSVLALSVVVSSIITIRAVVINDDRAKSLMKTTIFACSGAILVIYLLPAAVQIVQDVILDNSILQPWTP